MNENDCEWMEMIVNEWKVECNACRGCPEDQVTYQ